MWSVNLRSLPRLFQGVQNVKIHPPQKKIILIYQFFSYCIDTCTDGAKAWGLKLWHLSINQGNGIKLYQYLLYTSLSGTRRKKNPISFKNALNPAVKIINIIKAQSSSTIPFHIHCDERGSMHKELTLHTELQCLSQET